MKYETLTCVFMVLIVFVALSPIWADVALGLLIADIKMLRLSSRELLLQIEKWLIDILGKQ